MKLRLLFLLTFCIGTICSQDCAEFTGRTELVQNDLLFNALNGVGEYNSVYLKKKNGPNGSISLADYASLIYASNIWAGGYDEDGQLRVSASTYVESSIDNDWSPGPLLANGDPLPDGCELWDKTYDVNKEEIITAYYISYEDCELKDDINCDEIPDHIKYWPARGNPFLFAGIGDEVALQDYAQFYDQNQNGVYDPCNGDLPFVAVSGCESNVSCPTELFNYLPDQFSFWIMNDNSNSPNPTQGENIGLEIQNYSVYFPENGNQDLMWYYKIINKGQSDITDFRFSFWIDFDLGCYKDDYLGSNPARGSVFVYNTDAIDGENGGNCDGVESFDDKVPAVSVKFLRGLRSEENEYSNMSSVYFPSINDHIVLDQEFYNVMSGLNPEGTPVLDQDGNETKFMFDGNPSISDEWSMCSPGSEIDGLLRQFVVMSSGPVDLPSGETNEVQMALLYSYEQELPCPDLNGLYNEMDITQSIYDNCGFSHIGPSAPEVNISQSSTSFDLNLNNDFLISNNRDLSYEEKNFTAPPGSLFLFEGYKVYQVGSADFDLQMLDDSEYSQLIFQADLQNDVSDIYNYEYDINSVSALDGEFVLKVEGANEGVSDKFTVDYDYLGNTPLEIGNSYHYVVIAYGYSDGPQFDPSQGTGLRTQYVESSYNMKVTSVEFGTTSAYEPSTESWNAAIGINYFELSELSDDIEVSLYSLSGQQIDKWMIEHQTSFQIDVENYIINSGIYVVTISAVNNRDTKTYKLPVIR